MKFIRPTHPRHFAARRIGLFAAACMLACVVPLCNAAPLGPKLVTPQMLAEAIAVTPGKPFTVGVKLNIVSGWHVYWINPGDSGQPVEVEWKLPEGFTVSPLRYPLPDRFKDAGGLVSFGYTREVMLTATVTPPADLPTQGPVKIAGNVTWLACRSECVPGKATVSLELSVKSTPDPVFSTEFEKWKSLVPREADEADPVRPIEVRLPSQPRKGGTLMIVFETKPTLDSSSEGLEWFPPPSESVQFEQPVFSVTKGAVRMTVEYKVFDGQEPEAGRLESVLAYRSADKVRRGIVVPIILRSEK